ncbi:ATP-dependent helicase ComFA [Barrientosiimonas marina]|uniref:DEAD/DEAH box helicase n=1 Tax=Lentibacillus kimchii TaxID=1542911 RepID=A0ABW2UV66_9BACI
MDIEELSQRYAGKFLLRSEIPLEPSLFERLLTDHFFTVKPSIRKTWLHYECQRCGNRKRSLFGHIPAQRSLPAQVYCRKCIEMGRVIDRSPLYEWTGPDYEWPLYSNPCTWDGALTAVQEDAAQRIVQAIRNHEQELLTWAVCGAGKTEMLYPGITESLKQGKRICIATPRADVVRELLPRLRSAFSGVTCQGLYGGSPEKEGSAQMMVATTHQLLRYKHAFDVMIIDEVDAFPYTHDPTLAFAAHRARREKGTLIYLTATPAADDQVRMSLGKLPHVFVPKRFHNHPLPVPILRMIPRLKKDLAEARLPESFIKWLMNRKNRERQVLIFVNSIKLAEVLTNRLAANLVQSTIKAVHASDANREENVQQFRDKRLDILVTTTILERGVTFPSIDVAILDAGSAVFGEQALVQIAGRAGRSPHDPTGEVVFFHDGKTDAMIEAVKAIQKMNKRGGFL